MREYITTQWTCRLVTQYDVMQVAKALPLLRLAYSITPGRCYDDELDKDIDCWDVVIRFTTPVVDEKDAA